jgi:MFS-type transporter involved in bile tolerance (Atg22 family)
MVVKMVPPEGMGEVFGIFNLIGYLSAIIGGLFWGGALLFFSGLGPTGYRIALFSLNLFFAFGIVFFLRLRIP